MAHRLRHGKSTAAGRKLVIGSLGAVSFPQEAQGQLPCSSPSSSGSTSPSSAQSQGEACEVCGSHDNADRMLLCDGCDRGYHTFCVGLKSVPTTEEWFGDCCALKPWERASSSSAASAASAASAPASASASAPAVRASPSKNAKLSGILSKLKQRSPMLQASVAPPTAVSTLPPLQLDTAGTAAATRASASGAAPEAREAAAQPHGAPTAAAAVEGGSGSGDDSGGSSSLRASPTSAGQDSALTMGSQRTALSLFDSEATTGQAKVVTAAAQVKVAAPSPPRPRPAAKAAATALVRGSPGRKQHAGTRTSPGIRRNSPSPLRPKVHSATKPLTMPSSKAKPLPAPRYMSPAKGVSYARSFAKPNAGGASASPSLAASQRQQQQQQEPQQQPQQRRQQPLQQQQQPQTRHAQPTGSMFAAAANLGASPGHGKDVSVGAGTGASAAIAAGAAAAPHGGTPHGGTPFSSPTPTAIAMARTVAVAKAKPSPPMSSTMRSPGQRLLASSSSGDDDDDTNANAANRKRSKYTRVLSSPDPKRRREAPRTAHQEEVEEDRKAEADLLAETASNRTLFG